MNQIAQLCEQVGADVGAVRKGIGTDRRIGPAFLFPGPGYGGSCFPKDVKALIRTARGLGMSSDLWESVEAVNERQKFVLLEKLTRTIGDLRGRQIAVWGLAFKPETDDMRESPSVPLVEGVLAAGGTVVAHDPKAVDSARAVFGDRIRYAAEPYEATEGSDALVIVTEWLVYRNPDLERVKAGLRAPIVIDGRNLFDPARMRRAGFRYVSLGRVPA
jgi:UDPglucose 6-dehydrogenase